MISRTKNKPIKRNVNLVELSKEHHFGLLACWKVRQGIKKEISSERITKYILYFWENHLEHHFEEEERFLFIDDNEKCQAALEQHKELKNLILLFQSADADYTLLTKWANLLDSHIRFEERELFPHLEQILPESRLEEIGQVLAESHHEPACENYEDSFWAR